MYKYSLISFLCSLLLAAGCTPQQKNDSEWKLIFKNDESGGVLSGSKNTLIKAVREGYPIRIGWAGRRASDTTKSVEHVVDASFLTISNEKEVFAQIQPIIGQNPDLESDTLAITFRENLQWAILVGTNGFTDRLTVDRLENKIAGHNSRAAVVSWFAKLPNDENGEKASTPLW